MPDRSENEAAIPRAAFEQFLQVYTHEIRNRLNAIALEAADLTEQAGPDADGCRLQGHVQECAAFLKKVRDTLASDSASADPISLTEFTQQLRERKS